MIIQVAAQTVIDGDISTLKELVQEQPGLVTARSLISGAILPHYVGAHEPVEDHRQEAPPNAIELARFLLSKGVVGAAT